MDNRICATCVSDDYLKTFILESPVVIESCDYCNMVAPTISMYELAGQCDAMIDMFYDPTNMPGDDGFEPDPPEGDSLLDILQEEVGSDERATKDLEEMLGELWFDVSSMEHKYGEDPHFVGRRKFEEPLVGVWEKMERSLRHEARLVNPTVTNVLEEVFGGIHADTSTDGKLVVVTAGPKLAIDHLYRARVFQTIDAMEEALAHPERNLGPPPEGKGAAGRMNAKGVSVFYGSTVKDVALAEVRPPVGSHVAIVKFKLLRPLRPRCHDSCPLG